MKQKIKKLGQDLIDGLRVAATSTPIEKARLCWECNNQFRGNKKYSKVIAGGYMVYVHKSCIKDDK